MGIPAKAPGITHQRRLRPLALVCSITVLMRLCIRLNSILLALGVIIDFRWVGTKNVAGPVGAAALKQFSGLWIAPASPYKSMEGALLAIRTAREGRIPLLGTCGGFQHIILEFARNVLGLADAQHGETDPHAARPLISRLACSLVGRSMTITLKPGSLVARLYGRATAQEQYRCNFGVNPDCVDLLGSSALRIVGSDDEGVVRAVELQGHPFLVGTLFLPQHTSTPGAPHPLITGFIKACAG
jgi:CTP synthase (UTP-ammonia lyase)